MNSPEQSSVRQESSLSRWLDDDLVLELTIAGAAVLGVFLILSTDRIGEAVPPAMRYAMSVLCVVVGVKSLIRGWREWTRRRDLCEHGPDAERTP